MGAFRKIVDGRVATALVMPDHDWFVGMGEVIVGPMSLADLRIRAGRGAVTAASLVWREGFDDWQPLGGFPEVLAVLQDAVDPGRPDPPVLAERPSVAAPGELGSPFEGAAPPSEIPGVRRGPSLNGVLAAAVAGSLLLGFGAGFLWFGHGPAAATADTGAASPVERPGNRVAVGFDEASRVAPDVSSRHDPGTQGPPPGGASEVGGPILGSQPARDPTTRRGLESLAAPRAPTAATSAALAADPARAGGQPLEEGQVQRTVSRQAGAVRRACWQPALDRRADGAPSTARVVVTIEIHPSGSVSSVTATPDPTGYPGLSACIAGRVRAWQFPPSGGGTVKVPFVFAGQ